MPEKPPPLPPVEMRRLVGPTEDEFFDNPGGVLALPDIDARYYAHVLDFGCGCGRVARRMIQQRPQPKSYLGIDIHAGMIKWCQANLTPYAPNFAFRHFDVYNIGFNPAGSARPHDFPAESGCYTLVNAWSVFTHILEPDVEFYLREVRRVMTDDAMFLSTWFLMEKLFFPMMQDFQNALYINTGDPTNAVIFDREWVSRAFAAAGLRIIGITPPKIRGFAWILIASTRTDLPAAAFPEDDAPFGVRRPPLSERPPSEVS
jgi:SAM-dependent methyltransferase